MPDTATSDSELQQAIVDALIGGKTKLIQQAAARCRRQHDPFLVQQAIYMTLTKWVEPAPRMAMVRALLAPTAGVRMVPGVDGLALMDAAIQTYCFDCLPLLAEAGFTVRDESRMARLMGQALGVGHWPWPELIYPRLLFEPGAVSALTEHWFTDVKTSEHTQRCVQLESDVGLLSQHLSSALGALGREQWRFAEYQKQDVFATSIGVLMKAGWIEGALTTRIDTSLPGDVAMRKFLVKAEETLLDTQTATASWGRRGAMRL